MQIFMCWFEDLMLLGRLKCSSVMLSGRRRRQDTAANQSRTQGICLLLKTALVAASEFITALC